MTGAATEHGLRSRRVVLPGGERPAVVAIEAGAVAAVLPHDAGLAAEDLGDLVLLPGLVDTHVHLNEPGNTHWEGFATGTAAAVAGGFTTVVDMPLNSLPVTTTPAAVAAKRAAAAGKLSCNVGLWGGVTAGMDEADVEALLDAGVLGVKAFLCDSGLPQFEAAGEPELRAAMRALERRGLPLLAHAEAVSDAAVDPAVPAWSHAWWLASRPPRFERDAVDLLIRLCRETGCRTHVVHVADTGCLPRIAAAKAEGLPLTAETCPHYLCFAAEEVADGDTRFKCAPPIRDAANREGLWAGLVEGTLDLVASDHSPCPPAMKPAGRFDRAWGGIASLQVSFHATWAEAGRRGFGLADVVRWMGAAPAALAGRPFGIAPGNPADLVALDSDACWTVRGADLFHRHPLTPYEGREVRGRVEKAWVGGRPRRARHHSVPPAMTLDELNAASEPDARDAFAACCGTRWWAQQMAASRPFRSAAEVHETAEMIFEQMAEGHWLEAFAAHPRIGDPPEAEAMRSAGNARWSGGEQAGMSSADDEARAAMAEENANYEARFGWPFIVCASGLTADQMLVACVRRRRNAPEKEAAVAAGEQRAITALRIDKLLAG